MNEQEICVTVNGTAVNAFFMQYYLNAVRLEKVREAKHEGRKLDLHDLIERAIDLLQYDYALLNDQNIMPLQENLFEHILKELHEENESRKKAIENDETVYGVTSFSFETYLDYIKENRIVMLRNYLHEQNRLSIEDKDLEEFYLQIKNSDPLFIDDKGELKNLDSVRAKVMYFYEQNEICKYLKAAIAKQEVNCEWDSLTHLAGCFENNN